MDRFGFIVHPPDIDSLYRYFLKPGTRRRPDALIEKVLEWTPPFKVAHVTGVKSVATGKEIEGYLIVCPLLPKQFLESESDLVLQKIVDACKMAQDWGAKLVGLGGFTSVVGDQGRIVAEHLDIPVTTGNSYTAAAVIEGIFKAAEKMGTDLSRVKLAIIGATGSIGSACARILAQYVPHLVITARNQERLAELADTLCASNTAAVEIAENPKEAVRNAEVVITTTSATEALIGADDLKSGAIVCDVAVPKNVSPDVVDRRNDVLIFEGGMVEPPGNAKYNPYVGLLDGLTYACMAEAMILVLEGRFETYSLGRDLSLEKINEISYLAIKHSFKTIVKEKHN